MAKLNQTDFASNATDYAKDVADQRKRQADAYETILTNIELAMTQARTLIEQWPPSTKGITELGTLVKTAEMGFGRIASEVIAEQRAAEAAATAEETDSSTG